MFAADVIVDGYYVWTVAKLGEFLDTVRREWLEVTIT